MLVEGVGLGDSGCVSLMLMGNLGREDVAWSEVTSSSEAGFECKSDESEFGFLVNVPSTGTAISPFLKIGSATKFAFICVSCRPTTVPPCIKVKFSVSSTDLANLHAKTFAKSYLKNDLKEFIKIEVAVDKSVSPFKSTM